MLCVFCLTANFGIYLSVHLIVLLKKIKKRYTFDHKTPL